MIIIFNYIRGFTICRRFLASFLRQELPIREMIARQNVDIGTQESVLGFGVAGIQGAQVVGGGGPLGRICRFE